MADAQTEVNKLNKDASTEIKHDGSTAVDKWSGKLIIKGFKEITKVDIENCDITEVVIEDCPKLTEVDFSDNNSIKKIDLEKAKGGTSDSKITIVRVSGNGSGFEELNLINCTKLERLVINDLGEVRSIKGAKDFDKAITTISTDGSTGLHLTTTEELERLEAVETVTGAVLGGKPPTKIENGKLVVDADALRNDLIVKGSENPSSPAQIELSAIKTELGLGTGTTQQQIIAEIKRLKDIGSSSSYISKVSLTSDAKNSLTGLGFSETDINKELSVAVSARDVEEKRNKLVSGRFNELQSKLHNANYLNIGSGTLSAGLLVILTWMILKDRKLLPSQEDEEVKE